MKRNENKKSLTKKIVAGTGLALLLALVGYTGADTYAKYITTGEVASQTATVAKWGVVLNASAANSAFDDTYSLNGTYATAKDDGLSVNAYTNVVAPGTAGEFTFSISGTPEVAAQLSFEMVVDSDVHTGSYYPIIWTISGGDFSKTGTLAQIAEYLNGTGGTQPVQTYAPSVGVATTIKLSWAWAFESSHDAEDTILGDAVANNVTETSDLSYTVDFTINATVEQIQK